ncbi:MAG: hypothetical protein V1494_03995 [Candidatus Diapherotrites archaeon]
MATTTIQVEYPTKELLNELKKNSNSKTYDEVIQLLVKTKTKSMFGKLSKGKAVSAAEMLRGMRDKCDRF